MIIACIDNHKCFKTAVFFYIFCEHQSDSVYSVSVICCTIQYKCYMLHYTVWVLYVALYSMSVICCTIQCECYMLHYTVWVLYVALYSKMVICCS